MKTILLVTLAGGLIICFSHFASAQDSLWYHEYATVTIHPTPNGGNQQGATQTFRAGPASCKVTGLLTGTVDAHGGGPDYEILQGYTQTSAGPRAAECSMNERNYVNCPGGHYPCQHTCTTTADNVDLTIHTLPSNDVEVWDVGIVPGAIFWDVGTYEMTARGAWSNPNPNTPGH